MRANFISVTNAPNAESEIGAPASGGNVGQRASTAAAGEESSAAVRLGYSRLAFISHPRNRPFLGCNKGEWDICVTERERNI